VVFLSSINIYNNFSNLLVPLTLSSTPNNTATVAAMATPVTTAAAMTTVFIVDFPDLKKS